ncbi:histidinol-phosphate transaminase [Gordonia sp. OPL2]|uniref:pyridoxal phosphate-dependent aminotransferase n=1 Tax=Gordonia sp. OPL2 TaxID=2486274 RepID=UPI00165665F2|nr:histidinol-phosphate transaminase [Gordonia sp. OPL2]RPA10203.1 histidinol-phosphate aminotransferase family protein [Gordonia sp. OPL2]
MTHPGGPDRGSSDRLRLDLNESAYPPLPSVADAVRRSISALNRYPDFLPDDTRTAIAAHLGLPSGQVTVGPGATGVALAVLHSAMRHAQSSGIITPTLVTPIPTFDGYPILAGMVGMRVTPVRLADDGTVDLNRVRTAITPDTAVVVVCSPHNPTGAVVEHEDLYRFIDGLPSHVVTVVDQAYIEFAENEPDLNRLIDHRNPVVVLRTFSKAHGLAALRIGYGIGRRDIVGLLRGHEVPFAVSRSAIAAVPAALAADAELAQRVRAMRAERERLEGMLHAIGAATVPTQANFVFLPGPDGVALGDLLRACGIDTKQCGDAGTRITIGDRADTDRVVQALRLTAQTA